MLAHARHRFVLKGWTAELLPRRPYCARYTAEAPVIGFAFEPQAGTHAFGTDRRSGFRAKSNSLAYVPPGCDVYSESECGGEYLQITADRKVFSRASLRLNDVIDPIAVAAAEELRRLMLAGPPIDSLVGERCLTALEECVLLHLNGSRQRSRSVSWMTPARLRLIEELIDARLASNLTVHDLANVIGLSAGFFSRAFKAAIGKAPHDYLIDQRIARARALLAGTASDLSSVAHACGFASHAHMTATFRRRLGVAPRNLR